MEVLAGNSGSVLAHVLVHVEDITQVHTVFLHEDPGYLLHSFGAKVADIGRTLVEELSLLLLIHFLLPYFLYELHFSCKMC